jgi:molybdopterin-guanine dinucleotide biosynthesis protein A
MTQDAAQVTVRYFAQLRELAKQSEETLDLEAGQTAAQVYLQLAEKHGFKLSLSDIRIAINDDFVGLDHPLTRGDRLVFIPPVSGG